MKSKFSPVGRVARGVCVVLGLFLASEEVSSQTQSTLPCGPDDKACALKALRGHPVQKSGFWKEALGKPLEQRISTAPPELVEFLNLANIKEGYPNKPVAAKLEPDFLRDVLDAISELPTQVVVRLGVKLAGIYFVDDFGGTGYATPVHDEKGKPIAGFVVLDRSVLNLHTANAWATWKESTPFKTAPRIRLSAEIEAGSQDNRKNAIQYILLHELGHVLAFGGNVHPPWIVPPKEEQSTTGYPFFLLSWSISSADRRYVAIFDDIFPERKNVVYYLGAKLSAEQMLDIYGKLETTNFATLYAVTHPFDDFAESFVSYVHTVLMRKPFKISIYHDGRLAKEYGSCWEQTRCAEKKKLLETMLGGNDGN